MRVGHWYIVKWHDAYSSDDDWRNPKKADVKPLLMITTGKLVKQSKHNYCFAQTVNTTNGEAAMLMTIPRGMIIKAKRVRP